MVLQQSIALDSLQVYFYFISILYHFNKYLTTFSCLEAAALPMLCPTHAIGPTHATQMPKVSQSQLLSAVVVPSQTLCLPVDSGIRDVV